MASPNSKIKSLADLKGKVVAAPFGSTSHRTTLRVLKENNLVVGKDVELKNLDIAEMASLIEANSNNSENWSGIDVLVAWDPTVALLEEKQLIKKVHEELEIAVVAMSNDFITNNQEAARRFVKSYTEAVFYYAKNKKEANTWFSKGARRDFSDELLNKIASVEPFTKANRLDQVDLSFTTEHINKMDNNIKIAVEASLIPDYFDVKDYIDTSMLIH